MGLKGVEWIYLPTHRDHKRPTVEVRVTSHLYQEVEELMIDSYYLS